LSGSKGGAWERRDDESAPAYAAFQHYDRLGEGRSVDKAYQLHLQARGESGSPRRGGQEGDREGADEKKRAPTRWFTWCRDHEWVERARAHDAELAVAANRERERDHLHQLEGYRTRTRKLGSVGQEVALLLYADARAQLARIQKAEADAAEAAKGDKKQEGKKKPAERLPSRRDVASMVRAANQAAAHGVMAEAQALGVEDMMHMLERSE
jgi:hypothetical protein